MNESVREILFTIDSFSGSYWASLGIAAVLSYLGLFTVLRRIVFTSVALAQLAAAGVAAAFFVAERPALPVRTAEFLHRHGPTIGSLSFSLLGMLGLESRFARRHLSSDALVGLAYAAASAFAILLVWRSAVGLVELQNILAGEVLLSTGRELFSLWIGLIAVVGVQVLNRRPFLLVSYDPDFARAQGYHEQHHQRLLMGSLAVAVALALKTAGLLLVFAVLVLPALIGLTVGRTLREASILAIASALAATLSGYSISTLENWPVAPSISLSLLAFLAIGWVARVVPLLAWPVRVFYGGGAIASLVVAAFVFSPSGIKETVIADDPIDHGHSHPPLPTEDQVGLDAALVALGSEVPDERIAAAEVIGRLGGASDLPALLDACGTEAEPETRAACVQAIARLIEGGHVLGKLRQIADSKEPELAMRAATVLMELGYKDGIWSAIQTLSIENVSLFPRLELVDSLAALSGDDFGYDGFSSPAENEEAIARWDAWWQSHVDRLKFDSDSGWSIE